MRRIDVQSCPEGMILARPIHGEGGLVVLEAGIPLDRRRLASLDRKGISDILVVPPGEAIPDPTIPTYMDRYSDDFAPRLHAVFSKSLVNRTMQELFLRALGHATQCYRRYRLDSLPDEEQR